MRKILIAFLSVTFLCAGRGWAKVAVGEPIIMTGILQGRDMGEFVFAYPEGRDLYVPLAQMAYVIGIDIDKNEDGKISGFLGESSNRFEIDTVRKKASYKNNKFSFSDSDMAETDGLIAFKTDFFNKLLDIHIDANKLDMTFMIDSNEKLPNTVKYEAKHKRQKFGFLELSKDEWSNYQKDDRWWSAPVVDLTYRQSTVAKNAFNRDARISDSSGTWGANIAGLAFGLDSNFFMQGGFENMPQFRWIGRRMFLDDEPNALNITKFSAGDITGFGSSFFAHNASGRGISASSFKDYVTSADKTITISDTILDGWEVELYLNDNLIGFRQSGTAGRYEFANIPVTYGLNVFRLVFYGPYGEIRSEERRYYSGASPVKTGQFGYTFNAYQPERLLVETSKDIVSPSSIPIIDAVGYFGATDRLTLITGAANVQDANDKFLARQFGTLGAQTQLFGTAFQYNLQMDLASSALGHHAEALGNVYIGDVFLRYDNFGDLRSPISYQYGRYMKEIYEGRITGSMLFINTSYFLNYEHAADKQGDSRTNIRGRLSRQFFGHYNLSVENTLRFNPDYLSDNRRENDMTILGQFNYGRFGFYTSAAARTYPDRELVNTNVKADYRWDRYTYLSASYQRNWSYLPSLDGTALHDRDVFSVTASRVLKVGGISADMSVSAAGNVSIMLRYNISFGKKSQSYEIFTDAKSKFSDHGVATIKAVDDTGAPIQDITVKVNSVEHPVKTDEKGEAVVTDIQPYEKILFSTSLEETEDIALVPDSETGKYVLRPGAVREVVLGFSRQGVIEGQINTASGGSSFGYEIHAFDGEGQKISTAFSDHSGLFVLDSLKFGEYTLKVFKEGIFIDSFDKVKVDDVINYFQGTVKGKTDSYPDLKKTEPKRIITPKKKNAFQAELPPEPEQTIPDSPQKEERGNPLKEQLEIIEIETRRLPAPFPEIKESPE